MDIRDAVARCCRLKVRVAEEDERASGLRKVLNFGHTPGHAIEAAPGDGVVRHREAVAMGMKAALTLPAELERPPHQDPCPAWHRQFPSPFTDRGDRLAASFG